MWYNIYYYYNNYNNYNNLLQTILIHERSECIKIVCKDMIYERSEYIISLIFLIQDVNIKYDILYYRGAATTIRCIATVT